MGLPALFVTSTTPPLPALDEETRATFVHRVNELLARVIRERPAEGSEAERLAILDVSAASNMLVKALGARFADVLRQNINDAFRSIVRRETETAEPERKLALRHLEQALHIFGVVIEHLARALANVPPSAFTELFDEIEERRAVLQMSEEERLVARFQLEIFVGIAVLDSLDDLTYWAFRAISDARRVAAMPRPLSTAGLRGELARIRSRRAWLDWDAEEVARELAPWEDDD